LKGSRFDRCYKVVCTGEGSDEIFGGYVHFRIDLLQHNTQGQDAAEIQRLVQQLETANSVSRGMLMPVGKTGSVESVERLLGFVPGCLKSREHRKRTAAGEGAAGEPAVPAAAPEELPAKPSSEPPVVDGGLIAAIARIELEISSLDKQRQALKMAVEILRQRSGATPE
jgi:hypothetical protein